MINVSDDGVAMTPDRSSCMKMKAHQLESGAIIQSGAAIAFTKNASFARGIRKRSVTGFITEPTIKILRYSSTKKREDKITDEVSADF